MAATLQPTRADLLALLGPHEPPCISLYEPTHHGYPARNQEDPVRYRNLLRQAEESLLRKYRAREFRPLLEKFERIVDDTDFWIHAADGIALFGSPDEFRVFKLPRPVPELLSVADSFHIKPLVRVLQRDEHYQVLALTLAEAKLYEGTRDELHRVDLKGIATTITEALGTELTEPFLKVARSYGGGAGGPAPMYHGAGGPAPMYHGQGSRKDEREVDRERFFRIIDREFLEHVSRRSGLPLLLAALPEHQAHFRELSRNPFLVSSGIEANPDALSPERLRKAASEVLAPHFEERLAKLVSDYGEARAHGRGSDQIEEVAAALAQARIATLLVEEDRRIGGKVDPVAGSVAYADPTDPQVDDILDDLAEGVLRTRGEVVIAPAAKMSTDKGLAAIYRF